MNQQVNPVTLTIEGMHCTNCAVGVERALTRLGAENVSVNFATSSASFLLGADVAISEVTNEIENLGYKVLSDSVNVPTAPWFKTLEGKFVLSLVFTVPLLLHMMLPFALLHSGKFQLIVCIPVFGIGFIHFGRSALRSLRAGVANMDVLIFIGINAAFIYSLAGVVLSLGSNYLFFETAATIITVVLLGNILEEWSVKKSTSAIQELTKIQASKANKITSIDGTDRISEVDISAITPGDRLLVNSGDKIPTDGMVLEGDALIDESMITGESVPVERTSGQEVIGGTIVTSGTIRIEATSIGEKTVLSQMIRLVEHALENKPEVQKLADYVSSIFVPVVTVIAITTLGTSWYLLETSFQTAMLRAIAVLVVACPCAMGLATPAAVMVGVGKAASRGILIKGGGTLELFSRVKTFIFDKTGTITSGDFKVRGLTTYAQSESYVRSAILALETHSSHPIAKSLVRSFSSASPLELVDIQETKGLGMRAKGPSGAVLELGSSRMVPANAIGFPKHDLYLLENGSVIGGIDVEDELKADAAFVIHALSKMGIRTVLLSGDKHEKCLNVAKQAGINEIRSEQSPEQKLRFIEDTEKVELTAYIGDGINDAAALARAAVGVSISTASSSAIQSAQVVLLHGNLDRLLSAYNISKKTVRIIKQNLFWAFFYNVLMIPLAALGFLTPAVAAFSMAFSDLIIVLNSLRLKTAA